MKSLFKFLFTFTLISSASAIDGGDSYIDYKSGLLDAINTIEEIREKSLHCSFNSDQEDEEVRLIIQEILEDEKSTATLKKANIIVNRKRNNTDITLKFVIQYNKSLVRIEVDGIETYVVDNGNKGSLTSPRIEQTIKTKEIFDHWCYYR